MISEIDWERFLFAVLELAEHQLGCPDTLTLDRDIVREIAERAKETVGSYNKDSPNVPKIAGHIAFWIRKLKPVGFEPRASEKFLAVNELVSLYVALAFCDQYHERRSQHHRAVIYRIPPRVVVDWATTMRFHSHSPHSTALLFEILMGTVLPELG